MKLTAALLLITTLATPAWAQGYNDLYGNRGTVAQKSRGDYFTDHGLADRPLNVHDGDRSLRLNSDPRQAEEAVRTPQANGWMQRQDALRTTGTYQREKTPYHNINPPRSTPDSRLYHYDER